METQLLMKQTYVTPELTVMGSVEKMTQAFGDPSAKDTIELPSGFTISGFPGSQDGVVTPRP